MSSRPRKSSPKTPIGILKSCLSGLVPEGSFAEDCFIDAPYLETGVEELMEIEIGLFQARGGEVEAVSFSFSGHKLFYENLGGGKFNRIHNKDRATSEAVDADHQFTDICVGIRDGLIEQERRNLAKPILSLIDLEAGVGAELEAELARLGRSEGAAPAGAGSASGAVAGGGSVGGEGLEPELMPKDKPLQRIKAILGQKTDAPLVGGIFGEGNFEASYKDKRGFSTVSITAYEAEDGLGEAVLIKFSDDYSALYQDDKRGGISQVKTYQLVEETYEGSSVKVEDDEPGWISRVKIVEETCEGPSVTLEFEGCCEGIRAGLKYAKDQQKRLKAGRATGGLRR